MKEIKIIFNDDEETLHKDLKSAISVYVDGEKLKNVESISIKAHQPDRNLTDKNGIIRLDKLLSYTVTYTG